VEGRGQVGAEVEILAVSRIRFPYVVHSTV
jgi:hypothetical protein